MGNAMYSGIGHPLGTGSFLMAALVAGFLTGRG
jgi:hypothetical protein